MECQNAIRRACIFDTTLRDGEQSPGAALTAAGKMRLARQLAKLGVDVIEAGFPAASRGDFEAVRRIAADIGRSDGDPALMPAPVICGLARALTRDIELAWNAVSHADRPRIHTFLAVSDVHLRQKLSLSRRAALVRIRDAVSFARGLCEDVEFSPEDATRADPEFLEEAVSAAIAAGASTINIPDTVGYALPEEFGRLMERLIQRCDPCGREIVYSAHCHDDLGLAAANTMAALAAGALQAEVTINGIGERAGNAALEEIVMAISVRGDRVALETGIRTAEIARTSRLASDLTGLQVQANKAVVGKNAFAHASGIHQDGILKDQSTYQIMRPEDVGLHRVDLVLGKHSGRHAFRERLIQLGADVDETMLDVAFARFKGLCDQKKSVTDSDLEALVADLETHADDQFRLADLQVVSGRPGMPTAT
ncbi:2-isopropylmalate synthase, partial [Candidatus Bipolaricaulota bacterium]|nr:2-isopropylmalate synthase [Candidatus Bipolaricaulota bacterium]